MMHMYPTDNKFAKLVSMHALDGFEFQSGACNKEFIKSLTLWAIAFLIRTLWAHHIYISSALQIVAQVASCASVNYISAKKC